MKRLALIGLLGLSLAACATPTAFAPAARPNGVGFSDMRIEQDRYRVTFQGGGPRLSTTLEIKLGRGPTPREPDVYDARDVRRTIGGRGGTLT